MGENLAAVNVTRSYTLAGTNIAIFTLYVVRSVPEVRDRQDQSSVVPGHTDCDGVATFSLVFATHCYRCSLGGRMSETERTLHAQRADRFWLHHDVPALSLVLFLLRLRNAASVWLAFWLMNLFLVVRLPESSDAAGAQ